MFSTNCRVVRQNNNKQTEKSKNLLNNHTLTNFYNKSLMPQPQSLFLFNVINTTIKSQDKTGALENESCSLPAYPLASRTRVSRQVWFTVDFVMQGRHYYALIDILNSNILFLIF